jgi:hypothetical protein
VLLLLPTPRPPALGPPSHAGADAFSRSAGGGRLWVCMRLSQREETLRVIAASARTGGRRGRETSQTARRASGGGVLTATTVDD